MRRLLLGVALILGGRRAYRFYASGAVTPVRRVRVLSPCEVVSKGVVLCPIGRVVGRSTVRTSCEHKRDHARPRAGHLSSSDSRGLLGFRALTDPRVPALPSSEPEW